MEQRSDLVLKIWKLDGIVDDLRFKLNNAVLDTLFKSLK